MAEQREQRESREAKDTLLDQRRHKEDEPEEDAARIEGGPEGYSPKDVVAGTGTGAETRNVTGAPEAGQPKSDAEAEGDAGEEGSPPELPEGEEGC